MAWQQPQGNNNQQQQGGWNPNAPTYTPYGQQQQQQQGGYQPQGGYQGGYQPQQQGGYYPQQQGGYYPQQGGYQPQQQYQQQQGYRGGYQGGYQPQQGGYGGYQPQQQPAPQQHADPEPSAADQAKLGLAPAKKEEIVMPKRTGGAKKLVIGGAKKKEEEPKKEEEKPAEAPKPAEAEKKAEEEKKEDSKPASPTTAESPKSEAAAEAPKPQPKKKKSQKTYIRDPRPHINVVFTGHVDAGKSTVSGHILADSGIVDDREMDKLRREAEQKHREGWEFAYVMDVSEEERAKGKTHETGAMYFETKERRITILDAPGHKAFVPSMIGGAAQADMAVMIISARTGEFETGFEKGGQTREHTMLLRTCGVKHMICAINKMDDCNWSKDRYDEILDKLRPFFKQNGYDDKKEKNVFFMPISGLSGIGLTKPIPDGVFDHYKGPCLVDYINTVKLPDQKSEDDPFCMPITGAYKDDGKVFIYGKVEAGSVVVGDEIQVLPLKKTMTIEGLQVEMTDIEKAYPGDNIHIKVKGVDEGEFHAGFVATCVNPTPFKAVEYFQARVVILDVKNIISAGSKAVLHIHSATEEVTFHKLLAKVDRKTGAVLQESPAFVRAGDDVIARLEVPLPLVVEMSSKFDKLGRFMLRDEGKTIAIGLVTKLYESTRDSLKQTAAPANKGA